MPRRAPPEPVLPPDVATFRDYRAFLRALFAYRKRLKQRPGLVALAKTIGLSNGHLGNIIAGRRDLNPGAAPDLALALGLVGDRARFFVLLVALDVAVAPAVRESLLQDLDALENAIRPRRRRGRPTNAERAERTRMLPLEETRIYTRAWLNYALFALLSCPRAPTTARGLARVLLKPTMPTAVQSSIAELRALGLVRDQDGRTLPTLEVLDATDPVGPFDSLVFTNAWDLARAQALARDPDTRLSATLCWPGEEQATPTMQRHIARFHSATLQCADASAVSGVSTDRPELPVDQEPARVVVQHCVMSLPLEPHEAGRAHAACSD